MAEVIKVRTELEDKLTGQLFNIKKAIAATFGVLTVTSIANTIIKVNQLQDRVGKLSIRLGESTKFLSDMNFVAERCGVSVESMYTAIQRANRRIAEFAATGRGEAAPAIKALDLEIRKADGTLKSFEELLPGLIKGFGNLKSQQDRTRIAMKLFDTEGVSMLQILHQTIEEINKLRKENEKFGTSIDEDAAAKAAEFNDNLKNLQTAASGLAQTLVNSTTPALTKFMKALETGLDKIKKKGAKKEFIENYTPFFEFKEIDIPGRFSKTLDVVTGAMMDLDEKQKNINKTNKQAEIIIENLRSDYEIYTTDIETLTDKERERLKVIKATLKALKEQEDFENKRREAREEEEKEKAAQRVKERDEENKNILDGLKARLDEEAKLQVEAFEQDMAIKEGREKAENEMEKIRKEKTEKEEIIFQKKKELSEDFFASMVEGFALFKNQSKTAFEAYKAFAVAEAIISTHSAAQKAYDSQILTFDPSSPLRAAVAASIAVAAGLARVASILNQDYQGRQFGGRVAAGQPVIVGERGREGFIPSTDGMVIPNRFLKQLGRPSNIYIKAIMDASAFRELLRTGGNRIIEQEVNKGRLF